MEPSSRTPAGSCRLVWASGITVAWSPGATKSLASTSTDTAAPGGALTTSSTATGGCGGPGGRMPTRTCAVPVAPDGSVTW